MILSIIDSKQIDLQYLFRERDKTTDSKNRLLKPEILLIDFSGLTPLQGQSTRQ